ncbi:MAG TPA: YMGG-like glycine zipper-containing protein [Candidatus Limnocylindria bacterium]|jgi:outer membrane lipoprotein SlyB|nr:YMGG-like glycine zipper-containing protein [Candidatus Limnocylindria bacterium]
MKAIRLSALAVMFVVRANAQLFGPESLGGAVLGGVAGGIIGHNSGHRTGEGVAIGAGVGLIAGAIVGNERRREEAVYSPGYAVYEHPNYAVSGAVVGGVAGAVIGNNSGHHTLEGAAIGAGAGLLVGSLAEQQARRRTMMVYPAYYPYAYSPPSAPTVAVPSSPAPVYTEAPTEPQPVIRSYPGSGSSTPGMTSANSLFGR